MQQARRFPSWSVNGHLPCTPTSKPPSSPPALFIITRLVSQSLEKTRTLVKKKLAHGAEYRTRSAVCKSAVHDETVAFLKCSPESRPLPKIACASMGNPPEEAKPITPPYCTGPGQHGCIVEYHQKPYSLTWSGPAQYPDLRACPQDLAAYPLSLSEEMAKIWTSSLLVDFGSHAVVRSSLNCSSNDEQNNQCFPIIKLAHNDPESLELISK